MRRWVQNVLIRLSGNSRVQGLLERSVSYSQHLMGIGSGSSPDTSGEALLVRKLEERYAAAGRPLCVFDVGANKGQFSSLLLGGLRGREIPCTIHAFEPARHSFAILRDALQGRRDVVLNPFGLGRESGELELFYDEEGSGLASLSKRRLEHFGITFGASERVDIRTLDAYCSERGVGHIDLLKLDVEGHELDVLGGGSTMFRERRIAMVSFEFGGCNIDSRTYFQDFWYFFKENGMGEIFRITPSGFPAPIPRYRESDEQFRTTNFLVLRSGG